MTRILASLTAALAIATLSHAGPVWDEVTFDIKEGTTNRVRGPGHATTSTRPDSGPWTVAFDLRNHAASLDDRFTNVYAAQTVRFTDYTIASGHAGHTSYVTFKLTLSEPVIHAEWDLGTMGRHISPGAKVSARYSLDGEDWREAYVYPAGGTDNFAGPTVPLHFDEPARVLYIGWHADVPEGQTGFWLINSTGTVTLVPVGASPAHAAASASSDTDADDINIQGARFIPNSFFGTVTHVNTENTIGLLRHLNINTVVINFRWPVLEHGRGDYAFSGERNDGRGNWMIDSADLGAKNGLDQVALLDQCPPWAQGERGTYPSDDSVEALEETAYRIALKYKGKIRYWLANNEPDMSVWKDRYIVFLKAFYKGIKRADPENKVLLAGFAGFEAQHLEAVYRLGGKDYFDILTSHPYTRPRRPEGAFLELMEANYRVMRKYGDDKPIWITEMGWNGVEAAMLEYCREKWGDHRAYSCTEEEQGRYLVRAHLLAATIPWVERFCFFHLHQEWPYDEAHDNADGYMGLFSPWLDGNVRPKDAWFGVKTVIEMLNEATYTEWIDMGERLRTLVFERDDEATFALWSIDDGITMTLDDASMITSVTSMVGTPILVVDNQLPISGRPIYLKTDLTNRDRLRDLIGSARLEGGVTFELALDLDMQRTDTRHPALGIRLANVSNHPQAPPPVFLQIKAPWSTSREKLVGTRTLAAGEERTLPVELSGPESKGGEVIVRANAHFFYGTAFTRTERTIRYVTAVRRPDTFQADGDLREWESYTPIEIGYTAEQRDLPGWQGMEDLSGAWYIAWDADALYFAADIHDNVHHQEADNDHPTDIWRSDSIQLAIDVGGDAKPSSNVPQYDNVNDIELGFAHSTAASHILTYMWTNPHGQPGPVRFDACAVVRDSETRRTRYEAVIPWSKLGFDGSPKGKWMGFNVLINDDDGEGRRGWINWAPGIGEWKDPSMFPKVLFD